MGAVERIRGLVQGERDKAAKALDEAALRLELTMASVEIYRRRGMLHPSEAGFGCSVDKLRESISNLRAELRGWDECLAALADWRRVRDGAGEGKGDICQA